MIKTLLMAFVFVLAVKVNAQTTPAPEGDDLVKAKPEVQKEVKKETEKEGEKVKEKKANFGQSVSAEAHRLKEAGEKKGSEFGKMVSEQRRKNKEKQKEHSKDKDKEKEKSEMGREEAHHDSGAGHAAENAKAPGAGHEKH